MQRICTEYRSSPEQGDSPSSLRPRYELEMCFESMDVLNYYRVRVNVYIYILRRVGLRINQRALRAMLRVQVMRKKCSHVSLTLPSSFEI